MEAGRKLPPKDAILQTKDSDYYLFKTDILAGLCTYSSDKNIAANVETISAARAREIIAMNRQGEKPLSLQQDNKLKEVKKPIDLLADADLSRFDKSKRKKNGVKNRKPKGDNRKTAQEKPNKENKPETRPNESQKNSGQQKRRNNPNRPNRPNNTKAEVQPAQPNQHTSKTQAPTSPTNEKA